MGRFAEVATRWGARVVGIDLSAAAEVAAKNLADREFVAFQADVFALPFAPESFDIIYSVGVLHHTPDCEAAVKSLDKYLKPGGILRCGCTADITSGIASAISGGAIRTR